jgi:hypothetical protein
MSDRALADLDAWMAARMQPGCASAEIELS